MFSPSRRCIQNAFETQSQNELVFKSDRTYQNNPAVDAKNGMVLLDKRLMVAELEQKTKHFNEMILLYST